eukprot:GEMP01110957.1.p1 GENE.GEMP01110957.1~~GEMP01110957.1.p1  ORF type:complete len:100 (+),score=7.27 GEMP01110957.1:46-300(+)
MLLRHKVREKVLEYENFAQRGFGPLVIGLIILCCAGISGRYLGFCRPNRGDRQEDLVLLFMRIDVSGVIFHHSRRAHSGKSSDF